MAISTSSATDRDFQVPSVKSQTDSREHSHVIEIRHLPLLVANDGKFQLGAGDLINVLDPATMALDGVGGQTNELDASPGELGLKLCEGAQLRCADWSVVLGVREQDDPVVADELVEVDGAVGGLGIEVGGDAAQAERLGALFGRHCI